LCSDAAVVATVPLQIIALQTKTQHGIKLDDIVMQIAHNGRGGLITVSCRSLDVESPMILKQMDIDLTDPLLVLGFGRINRFLMTWLTIYCKAT
jgi:hypothetical protein